MKYKKLNTCPICNHQDIYLLLIGIDRLHKIDGSWPLWQCKKCHVGFLNPMPQNEVIGSFYPQNYYAYSTPSLPIIPSSKFKRLAWYWKEQRRVSSLIQLGYPNLSRPHMFYRLMVKILPVKHVVPTYIPNGSLLDIGCGSGHYLLQMKNLGWHTTGVELTPSACDAANKAGLNVHQGNLEDMCFDAENFDIVRMSDVLEHVPDPHGTLDEIHKILKPNGKLEITLPNLDAWTFKLFHEYWFPLEIPRHLFHHTPKSIKQLAKQKGFKIESIHIWSHKEVDVIPSLQWYFQEQYPCLYWVSNHKIMRKIIRKIFAFPKAIASAFGKGSAMTVTMVKS